MITISEELLLNAPFDLVGMTLWQTIKDHQMKLTASNTQPTKPPALVPVVIYYSVENCGDGSAYPRFFLTEDDARTDQDLADEGWGESCTGVVDTYFGSDTYNQAVENSAELPSRLAEREEDEAYA